ncbi:glycoside hydrolase family 3 C-terminal domain-containing protein [Flavicella sediminum]|uniref:glycoside hydrolase family 3 C-terminal domain-containing protein n=1 Tax=Flavicella sediminum TaxID=2585141 RepID=UPI00111CC4D4|nr:glycoside hydrolase family 3 C-terminal domain-containing protein [Flavicella sediminum]
MRIPIKKILLATLLLNIFFICKAQTVDFSFQNPNLSIEERAEILVSQMTTEEKMKQLLSSAPGIDRLEVPSYDWWNEALHGISRNGKATIFPQGIAIGASFDPVLAKKLASAISTEARAKYVISQSMGNRGKYAGLTFWTPNVNIFRDPRWGRGQETYGEDPYLMSKIGVAFVNGLQGENSKYMKSTACAKHFAVHSGPEELRHHFNAEPTKQDLEETYFPAFEALVKEAKVEGVMSAYNAVYGKAASGSAFLLKETLRDRWNFDGYVVSDCGAIGDIYKGHKTAKTKEEAAAIALITGVNLNCGHSYRLLHKALQQGLISEELIHERTKQLFKTRFRLGILDKKGAPNPYAHLGPDKIHCEEHIALAREAAQKSIVLLKNKNNVLPLSKNIRVPYVTGPFANSADVLMGNYYGVSPNLVTVLEGIADAVSLGTSLNYRSGALPFQKNLNPLNYAPVVVGQSDATICVVGISADMEGEEVDAIASPSKGDRVNLRLPKNQVDYVKTMIEKKKDRPLILVIASGSAVSLEGIEEGCDAILQMWYPGEQGGNAVADVLFGNISPSGHLPITFPKNVAQLPAFEDYSMKGRTYKYMTKEPMFPFGFGLTYSSTKFDNLVLSSTKIRKNKELTISVDVANTGNFDMDEVVQLYVSPLKNTENLPLTSLKGFQRISLKKGEKKNIVFNLSPEDLKVINKKGEKVWLKGTYEILIGNSSPSPLSQKLGAAIPLKNTITLR